MKTRISVFCALVVGGLATVMGVSAWGGPLTPPAGPIVSTPGPEPRIALNSTNTPSNSNGVFVITQPGSYYLTRNLEVFNVNNGIAIQLNTEGLVTIDLMGYSVIGREGTLSGIKVIGPFTPRVVVRDGFVTSFEGNGLDLAGTESATIESVESTRNGGKGFIVGLGTFSDCKAQFNSGGGFLAGAHSAFSGCEAVQTGAVGFEAGAGSRFENCMAKGASGRGYLPGAGSTLTHCVAANNPGRGFDTNPVLDFEGKTGVTFTDCVAIENGGVGFMCGSQNRLTACAATRNGGNGIEGLFGCSITGCTAFTNTGYGIVTNETGSIVGCTSSKNTGTGIAAVNGGVIEDCVADRNDNDGISGSNAVIVNSRAVNNGGTGFALGGNSTVSLSRASSNSEHGIFGGGACLVTDCNVAYNGQHGIYLTLNVNTVRGNHCVSNGGATTTGANIRIEGVRSRIEDNSCTGADLGIQVTGANNIVARNTCGNNTTNWSIVANNFYGPIIDRSAAATASVTGNSAPSGTMGATDPNANFTH